MVVDVMMSPSLTNEYLIVSTVCGLLKTSIQFDQKILYFSLLNVYLKKESYHKENNTEKN